MRWVLVRHAESSNNRLYADTGGDAGRSPDPVLTDLGTEQALRLADWAGQGLSGPWRPTHLYSSLMLRALQTAAPLAEALDLPLLGHGWTFEVGGPYDVVDPDRTRVAHPGSPRSALLEVTPRLVLPEEVPAGEDGWWSGELEPEGASVLARAERVLADLRQRHDPDAVVVLVTHGWFTQYLLRSLLGAPTMTGWIGIPNTAVSWIEEFEAGDGGAMVAVAERVGWTPHLPEDLVSW